MLFAAGGAGFERILALRFRWLKPAVAFLVVVSAVVLAPVVLPILSPEKLLAYMRAIHFEVPRTETSHTRGVAPALCRSIRLGEMVRSVARVYASLPPEEQKRAAIFCQNYGEAGAIDFFWLEITDYRSALRPSKSLLLGTARLHRRDHDCAR